MNTFFGKCNTLLQIILCVVEFNNGRIQPNTSQTQPVKKEDHSSHDEKWGKREGHRCKVWHHYAARLCLVEGCSKGESVMQIRIISPHATAILELPGAGPGIMSDVELMRGAQITAYVGGAAPPVVGRSFVALPSPEARKKK